MDELLASLAVQTVSDFEVVVVEDGSTKTSFDVCQCWGTKLSINYLTKENTGPGPSRNFGCEHAKGEVFIFLDSDCTVPETWLENVIKGRTRGGLQAFGGPDREHPDFSPIQKAIATP